jgi:hypothetical protein
MSALLSRLYCRGDLTTIGRHGPSSFFFRLTGKATWARERRPAGDCERSCAATPSRGARATHERRKTQAAAGGSTLHNRRRQQGRARAASNRGGGQHHSRRAPTRWACCSRAAVRRARARGASAVTARGLAWWLAAQRLPGVGAREAGAGTQSTERSASRGAITVAIAQSGHGRAKWSRPQARSSARSRPSGCWGRAVSRGRGRPRSAARGWNGLGCRRVPGRAERLQRGEPLVRDRERRVPSRARGGAARAGARDARAAPVAGSRRRRQRLAARVCGGR